MGAADEDDDHAEGEDNDDLQWSQLGGCWCRCCHRNGCNFNGGQEFPHIPNANQNITPEMFSSLCRLGRELSKEAVDLVCSPELLESESPYPLVHTRAFETSVEDRRRAEEQRGTLG